MHELPEKNAFKLLLQMSTNIHTSKSIYNIEEGEYRTHLFGCNTINHVN